MNLVELLFARRRLTLRFVGLEKFLILRLHFLDILVCHPLKLGDILSDVLWYFQHFFKKGDPFVYFSFGLNRILCFTDEFISFIEIFLGQPFRLVDQRFCLEVHILSKEPFCFW